MAGNALKLVAERPGSIVVHSPFDDFVRKFGTTQRRGIFGYFVHDLGRRIIGGEYPPEWVAAGSDVRRRGRRTDETLDLLTRL